MRKKFKRFTAIAMSTMLYMCSLSVHASEAGNMDIGNIIASEDIITINNCGYNAEEFMERVISCTTASAPLNSMVDDSGNLIEFTYNDYRQRVSKVTESGTTTYTWNNYGNIEAETLPNGETIEYLYTVEDGLSNISGLSYQGNTYTYILDNNGIITGLSDSTGQAICLYEYNEFGLPLKVYEVNGSEYIEHQDNGDDNFIGCLNAIRYNGNCYDAETAMYCNRTGSYYDPGNNEVLGSSCSLDMEELFGDQYSALTQAYENGVSENSARISSDEIYYLIYAASQNYENGINSFLSAGEGDTWYTDYSGSKVYYLIARIIYGENGYSGTDSTMSTYLKYNRQGVGWEILNRYLEDSYRYDNGKSLFYSASGTTTPSFYSILTKNLAFTSINGHAKDEMNAENTAYQEAFWIASCIKVCNNFEKWNAVVPRPAGVTYQCYNRGGLSSSSKPQSTWSNVVFPGWSTNYAGATGYSAFTYYNSISRFNVLFSYSSENLYIKSVYYN